MPTSTYVALATTTLASASASVTFSSIPATYRDLVLIASGATTTSDTIIKMNFNNDTTDSYSYVQMYGETGGAGSDSNTLENIFAVMGGTGGIGTVIYNIMDYSSDKHKTVLARENALAISWTGARASRWPQTTAINEIDLTPRSGNFAVGCTFSLFGIEA
jgi:hypothetical protein